MVTKVNILKLQHGNIVLIFALVLLSPLPFVSPFSYNHQPAQAMIFDNPQIPKNFMVIPTASSIKLIDVELIHDVSSGGEVSGNIFNLRIATRVDAIDIKESVFVMAASNSEGFQFLNVTDPNNESIASNSISTFYRVSRNNIIANDFSAGAVDISPVKIGDFTYALLVVNSGTQGGSTGYAIPSGDIIQIRNITDLSPIIGPAYVSEFRPAKNVSFVTTVKIDGSVYALSTSVINHSVHMTNITNVSDPSVLFNVDNNTAGYETLYGALGITTVQINGAYYALVTSFYDSGVTIINITDPTNASRVSSIVDETKLDKSYDITTVKINNSYYALVTSSNTNSLTIINITNPASPNFINTITLSTEYQILEGARGVSAVQINDTYYAMVTADMGVQIINITTPSSPTPVSGIKNDVVEYTALSHSTDIVTIQIGELNYTFVTSFLDNAIQVIKHEFILDPDTYPIVVTSNNTDPWYAKAGDNITVQVKVNNTFTTHNASILNATLQTHVENSSYMLNASVLVPNYAIGEYAAFNITVANGIHTLTITEDDLRYVRNVFVDTVRPGITLIDDANYIVYTNTNPTIPGASATDNDPGYSNGYSVSSSGQLNTSMVGSVVTYTYTANSDTAGNRGESVTRNVTVASGPPIDLVNLSIYSEVNYDGSNVIYVNESKRVSIFENTDSVIIDGAMIWGVGGNNTNNDNNLNFTLRPNQQTIIFYFYMPPNTNGNITFSTSVTSNFGSTLVVTHDNITDGRFVIADTISPVITLIGNSTVTINAGENYTDMGASINDTNLIPNPIISSNASDVNTTIPGTYIIEYSASADLAGNKPSNVTRELTVNANPIEITLLKIASSSNNNFARAGQNVTVVLETDGSDLVNAVGTVLGSAFTNVTAGGSGNFTVTVLSGDTNGNATFSITVENSSLNIILITEENITDGSFVTIDTIKPIIVLTGGAGSVLQDETYQDPGTTISDSNNASYAGSVSNTSLNTAILGPQNITYTGTADAAGNVPDSINRTITVLAKPLGLNSLTIESNNNVNTSFAKDGDVITVTLATNGTIGNVTGVIAGNSATYTATGDSASVMVTVDGTFTDTASVTFSINASNADNLAYKIFTDTNLTGSNIAIDTIPPSITLNGANNTIVIMNQPYEDPNATASDASYATGSVQVSGAGNVDITTNAIYTLTYTAPNDPAGNIGSVITRTVTVQDAPPINVNSLSIASNSGNNYANAGKTVTVTLVTDGSDLGNITGTLLGRALINDTNGGSSVFTATVVSGDNGNATFSITMTNSSGNRISVTNANITDSSSVTIDTADPQLQNLTISSDNSNSTIATINDTLTITITADEALKGANVTVLGTTYTMNINNDTASANITVNSTNPEGNVTFNITAFDLAENILSANHTNLNSSNVTIDRTNPQLMNLTIYSDNPVPSFATLNDNLTITITANESLKAADIAVLGTTYTMNISGTTATATVTVTALSSEGNVTFDITAADLAGNTLSANQINLTSSNVTIDRTAPSGVNLIVHSDNADPTLAKAGDVINITLMAAEPIMNATLQIFDNDNITMTVTNDTASANIPVPQNASNGQIMFNITAEDISGNTFSVTQANITSGEVRVDTIDPKLTNLSISSDNSNSTIATINDTLTITITANEALKAADIAVLGTTYTMNISGTTATATVTVTALSSEGNVTFDITAFDLAGNTLSANQINLTSSNVTIDRTNPQLMNLTIYSDNPVPSFATLNDNLTITITANEALKAADIAVLGTTYTMNISGTTATATVTVTALSSEGNVTFDITAADLAGNTLSANQINLTSSNVTIDRTNPQLMNLTIYSDNHVPSFATLNDNLTITITADETLKGANVTVLGELYTMNISGTTATATVTVTALSSEGNVTFDITAADLAGNTLSANQINLTSSNVTIDRTNPQLMNLTIYSDNPVPSFATLNDNLTITITANEALKAADIAVLGTTYTMNISGTTATATVTVTALSSEGNVTFDITAADLAGNTLSANHTNLNSSNVTIDRTNPQLMNLTIYSDNHVPSFATLNDNLTITITANEALKAADIAVLGTTYTMNISGTTATATVTVTALSSEGNVTFDITAADLAGNTLSANQINLTSSNVTIDRTAPSGVNLIVHSDNADPTLAKAGDVINITLMAAEPIMNATLQIFDNDNITMTVTNDTASANIPVPQNASNGQIMFNITAEDISGNTFSVTQANITSGEVRVDTIDPKLTNLSISSDNSNSTIATINDTLTITITADEALKGANVTVLGTTYTMNINNDTASANVTVNSTNPEGNVTFNITAFDLAGNTLSANQINLTSSNVTIDRTNPQLMNLTIYSDNPVPSFATLNDNLTITITANDALKAADIAVLGTTYTMNISGTTATATVTVTALSSEGNVTFDITAADLAGNTLSANQINLTSSNVTIDRTNPQLMNLTIYSDNHVPSFATLNDNLTITITADETLKGANVTVLGELYTMNISGTTATATVTVTALSSEGNVTFDITAADLAGNTLSANQINLTSSNVTIDRTAPSGVNLIVHSDNADPTLAKAGDVINITLMAAEPIMNATLQIFDNDNITMTVTNDTASANIPVPQNASNGQIMFNITAEDISGNTFSVTQANITSGEVRVDTIDPKLTNLSISSDNSNSTIATINDTLTITITADEALKGANVTVLGTTYTMNINNDTASANVTVNSTNPEGNVTFNITAFDLAGNTLSANQINLTSSNVTIDRTAPSGVNLIVHSDNADPTLAKAGDVINITLMAAEPIMNATLQIFDNDNITMTVTNDTASANIPVPQNASNGQIMFNITAEDISGNTFSVTQANITSGEVRVDTIDPKLTNLSISSDNSNSTIATINDTLTITITADETLKGANVTVLGTTYTMNINNDTASANVTVNSTNPEGNVTFNITAFDLAGNILSANHTNLNSSNVTIDRTNPQLMNLTIYSDNHVPSFATLNDNLTITITANEALKAADIAVLGTTYTMNISGTTATATVTVTALSSEGNVTFDITAADLAGNTLSANQINLTSSNVTIDRTAPSGVNLIVHSDNADPTLAKAGDVINITLMAAEPIMNATLQIFDNDNITMTVTNDTASANIPVPQNASNGQIMFNITAEDISGNTFSVTQANITSGEVRVDTIDPKLTNLSISSDNSNSTIATINDTLTITITADEALKGANVTVLGTTYTMNINNDTASANVTVNSTNPEGNVTFNITAFDLAGNILSANHTNLNSSNVTIDRTNPQLMNLTIYSDNHVPSFATLNDNLTITITANEALKAADIAVLGTTYTMNISGTTATATVTVTALSSEGNVTFDITAADLAGNTLSANQINLTSSNVTIDRTAPSGVNLIVHSDNADPTLAKAGDVINITLMAAEPIMNATLQIFDNDNITMTVTNDTASANIPVPQNASNGQIMFNITAEDISGNTFSVTQANITSGEVRVDTIDPKLTNLSISSDNSNSTIATINDTLTITITADEALKGANVTVLGTTYTMNINNDTASANVTVNSTNPEGNVTFNITAFDLAGNTLSANHTNLNSSNVTIDRTNPQLMNLTIYSDNHVPSFATLNDNLTITITANEALKAADIAVLGTTYTMNISGTTATATVTVTALSSEGNVTFDITAADLAGNTLSANQINLTSSNVTIDRTAPSGVNLIVHSDNADPTLAKAGDVINITLMAAEPIMNATLQIFDNDNITMTVTNDTASANIPVPQNASNGQIMFNITAEDISGNTFSVTQANITSGEVRVDTIDPKLTNLSISSDNSNSTIATINDTLTITITADEALKGANVTVLGTTYTMNINNDTASANVTVNSTNPEGNVTFNITAFDLAGNTLSANQINLTSSNVTIDRTNPQLMNLTIYSDNHVPSFATLNDNLTITITANEALKAADIAVLGTTYTMNISGTTATATVTVTALSSEGNVTFDITAADLAGNTLSANQINLTSSNVTIDRTAPSGVNLIVHSDNADPTLAKAGDVINITLMAAEPIMNATLQIFDNDNITMTVTNDTASANIPVPQNASNGQIMFNITAEDISGNTFSVTQANITSGEVRVDTIDPKLTNLSISSDNSNSTIATINDTLTITITADEALKGANVTVLGTTYTMNINNDTASANVTVNSTNPEGNVTFNITAFDLAGNILSANQINLTSSNVTIDRTNPQLMNLTIYSDNHVPSFATLNDNLTITITADETLKGANVTVLGELYTMNISGTTATATVTVTALSSEGNVTFDITAADLAGNTLSANHTNLNSSNVTIDRTAPSGVNLIVHSDNADPTLAKAGDVINITLMAAEPIMNATLQIFDNDNITMTVTNDTASANIPVPQNASNGQIMFNITAEDISGNTFSVTQANITSGEVRVDTIDPKLTNLSISSDNSNSTIATINDTLTITITADEALKGANVTVLGTTYTMNINNDTASANVTVNSTNPEGNVTFNITAFDLAGNTLSANHTNLNSSNVTIDRTNPQLMNLTIYSDNHVPSFATLNDNLTITITADETLKGANVTVLGELYTMNISGTTATATVTVTALSSEGNVTFDITAADLAGNTLSANHTNLNSSNVTIDRTNPQLMNLTIYSDNPVPSFATLNDNLTITITANEALKAADIAVLGTTYTMNISGTTATATVTVTALSSEGNVTFDITAADLAGNTLSANHTNLNSSNVTIDRTNPQLMNLTIYSDNHVPSFATLNDNLTITITANEALKAADIAVLGTTYTMNISGTTATATVTVTALSSEGNVTFDITAADLAGNTLSANQINLTSSNVTIDRTAPSGVNLIVHSDNADPTLAKAGDVINITLMAAEPIMNATLQIFDNDNITMTVTNDTASANIPVPQNASNGQIMFNITAEDISGNTFSVTQANITSGEVRVDTIDPKLTNLSISSDNSNSTIATINDTLTITITADEALKGANVTVLGTTYTMNINNDTASANVTVNSTNPEGNVTFNITAFDLAGNTLSANQINLTSSNVTIDRTAPSGVNLIVHSDNADPTLAKAGDVINITLMAAEPIMNATLQIFDNDNITMTVTNDTASANIPVPQNASNGQIMFNITAEDISGNTFSVTQANITSGEVRVDTIDPKLTNLSISSDNSNSTIATINDTLTITITADEALKGANVTVLGTTYTMNINNDTASANVTVNSTNPEGNVTFNITAFDLAGNILSANHTNLNSSNVTIDRTNPQLMNLTIYSDNHVPSFATLNDNLTITITANEALKAADIAVLGTTYTMNISGTTATATVTVTALSSEGNVTFDITAADLAGNTLSANQINLTSSNVTIDRTAPSGVNLIVHSDNADPTLAKAGDVINITLMAAEPIMNATLQIFDNDNITMTVTNDTASANIPVPQNASNGQIMFNITAEDISGNTFSVTQANITSGEVRVDTIDPKLTNLSISSDNSNSTIATINDTLTITITADETLKGANVTVLGTTYTMNINNDTASANVTVNSTNPEGNVTFNITAFDLAGNILSANHTNLNSSNVTIDRTNPQLMNLTIYSDNHVPSFATLNDNLTITITANEALKAADIAVLGTTYTMNISGTTATATVTVTALSSEGNVTFDITAADLAGNTLSANHTNLNSSNVTIDRTAPSGVNLIVHSDNADPTLAKAGDVINITLMAAEPIMNATLQIFDNDNITMTVTNDTASANIPVPQNASNGQIMFNITAEDISGNTFSVTQANITSGEVRVDTIDPKLTNLSISSDNSNSTLATINDILTITITADEALKGANVTVLGELYTMAISGTTATATVTVTALSSEGNVTFDIIAADLVGNTLSANQINLTSSNVTIDRTNPQLMNLTISSDNSNSTLATINDILTITITADETLKGANVTVLGELYTMAISGTTATATVTVTALSSEGNVTFDIIAADLVGNTLSANQINLTSSNVTIDRTAPDGVNLIVHSDNADPTLAKAGDVINITLMAAEPIMMATLQIFGNNNTIMSVTPDTASSNIQVPQNAANGQIMFNITAEDSSGNIFSVTQANITSGEVRVDTIDPKLTNLSISSDNSNSTLATINDILTITITADEALKGANVTVLGELYTMAISGTTATATVTVTALSSEGNVTFDITAADLAGNTLSANQINLTSSNVTIDRTNPQLMNLTISSDNSNSTLATINDILTITITADETLKGANVTVLGETYTMNVSGTTASANVTVNGQDLEGQVNFTITAFDLAGNSLMTNQTQLNSSNVTVLSKSLGQNSLTIASNNSNSSFAKDGDVITVSLVANNTIGYIVGTIAGNSAAYTVTGNNASATVTVDGTFADTASVIFSINASNVDNSTFRIFTNANLTGSNIAIDTTAPSITLNGINNTRVATNSSYTDPGATASDTSYATGSVQVSGAGTVTITTAGNYTLTYTAPNDPASNIGPSITRTVTVQDAPPININTLTLTSSNQNTQYAKAGDTLTLMLVINDTITSNTVQIQNGPPTTNSSSGSTLTATRIIPNSTIESNATFTITVTNINGTTLTVTEDDLTGSNVFVDTIPPNIILIGSANSGIVLDSTYTDQGANARDGDPNYSGNYTAQVNPPLNTSILGAVFVYTYTANADNAGNPGFSVNRTVTVSNTRSSSSESNAAPTLGKTSSGAQLVTNGFEYNGLAINVSRYHTEFPLIGTNVGDMNTIKMKIYDSAGPAGIKRVELALGVPDVGLYHEAEAFVEVWMQKDSIAVKEIVIVDKLNLLEDSAVSSTVSQISCTGDVQQCLLVEMKYSYREPPIYNTVSVKPVDWDNNAHQFYFNDGIHVDGDSINLPKEIDISTSHATGISNTDETLHLVQINRAEHLWVDQYGYQWIIIGNTVRQITIPEYLVPDDNTYGTLHGPDRNHPDFASIIYAEQKRAQETLAGILGHATIIKPLPENGGTIYFDATEPSSRDSDSFKLLLELEAERMYQISNLLYPDDT